MVMTLDFLRKKVILNYYIFIFVDIIARARRV